MVIKKKKLFYDIGIRYVWILCIYVVMSISLNEIVVRGNDYIAQVTDSMLTGKPVVLQNILIQMSGMIIVGTVAAYFADLSRKYYSSLVQREVRGRLAEHLLHLPYSYFDEKGSGSILTRFSSDIGEAGNFFSDILPDLLVDIVTVGTITAYFIQMDVRLIVILFASYPVMLLVADRLSKKLAVILRKFRTTMDDRTQIAYDAIQGIAIGKSYNLYHVMCARINAAIDKIADHGCKSTRISSMGWLLKGVITTIPVVVCYFFALFEVISNRISVGELLAFTILLSRVNRPLGNVMFCMNDIRASKVAMDRLETLYQAKKEEEAFKGKCTRDEVELPDAECKGAIVWKNVHFSYSADREVLKGISFQIKKGQMVAFAGGSGEGLKQVSEGTVDIGNSDVAAEDKLDATAAKELVDHQVCVVTMAPIVNKDVAEAGVKSLTKEQLISIFTGKTTNWKDVGGPDENIVLVTRPESSGTRATFQKYALDGNEEASNTSMETDDSGVLLTNVKSTNGAIGYVALSYLTGDAGVETVAIDDVEPTLENTYSGKYPVWTFEHMYTKGEPNEVTKAFLDYITGDEYGAQMEKLGYGVASKMTVTEH